MKAKRRVVSSILVGIKLSVFPLRGRKSIVE